MVAAALWKQNAIACLTLEYELQISNEEIDLCLIMTHNASAGSSGESTFLKTYLTPRSKPTM